MGTYQTAMENLPDIEKRIEGATDHGLYNVEVKQLGGLVKCTKSCPVLNDCIHSEKCLDNPCLPASNYILDIKRRISEKLPEVLTDVDFEIIYEQAMYTLGMIFQGHKWIYAKGAVLDHKGNGIQYQPIIIDGIPKLQRMLQADLKMLGLPRRIVKDVTELSDIQKMWEGKQ